MARGMATLNERRNPGPLSPASPVLAAPLGTFARFLTVVDGDDSIPDGVIVQSPDTQISRHGSDNDGKVTQWRNTCSRMLEMRGIPPSVFQGSAWLTLQYRRRRQVDGRRTPVVHPLQTAVLWPSALCFWKSASWLSRRPATAIDFDPLGEIQRWYLGAAEREELIARKAKELEAEAARVVPEPEVPAQHPTGYSPLALRRASNNAAATAAAGTMYPTPPDAVQNPIGVTPSFEGAVSSPENQTSTIAMVDLDVVALANPAPAADAFGYHAWEEGGDNKRERPGTAFIDEPENMYGDIGEDMFGDNDITDADFSFFDEQPAGVDLEFGSVGDMDELGEPKPRPSAVDSETKPSQGLVVSPVFTKPELKHARSSLGDEARAGAEDRNAVKHMPGSGIKRQSSPFNQETVYKRVKASLAGPAAGVSSVANRSARRGSMYEKVDFNSILLLDDKKYEENGRFSFPQDTLRESAASESSQELPTTGYLQRHGKGRWRLKETPSNMGPLIARLTGGMRKSSLGRDPVKEDDLSSDADDISLVSEDDDASPAPESPSKSMGPQRRLEDDAISLAASLKEMESVAVVSPQASVDLSRIANSDVGELSIAKYFADPEPTRDQLAAADQDFITIAQILTEQAASGLLELPCDEDTSLSPCFDEQRLRRALAKQTRYSIQLLRLLLPAPLGGAAWCQLRLLLEVQDAPLLGQPSRLQPRPAGGTEQLRPNLFQIPPPHIELRRHDERLSLLPTAVGFWEVLGLGPSLGTKDVSSVCVYPNYNGVAEGVGAFLDRMRILYESMKLGTHDRPPSSAGISDGLVPLEVDKATTSLSSAAAPRPSASAGEQMGKLAQALAAQTATEKNFVVYFVYMRENVNAIVDACTAFQRLFEKYKKALLGKGAPRNELVLQLIPMDFVASPNTYVLPETSEMFRLCLEVYDRCTMFGGPMPSPAIVLEQPLPRMIDFKLVVNPSTNVLHENSCLHLAYAQSVDGRWVTAAWTDNRGSKQMTTSYCLGRKGRPLATPFADIAHEMWETMYEMISVWKVHWRVMITKNGPMDRDEMELWVDFSKAETRTSISLTVLTVDTDPSLQLIPPVVKIPFSFPSIFCTTPVSTPQAMSNVSPEQSGNPPTPAGAGSSAIPTTPGGEAPEPEIDATLVDTTDTTWGALVSHRLNNSSSLTDWNPVLASGYLFKRSGTLADDPLAIMEVNVIHSEGNPRLYEPLLREVMTYFRGLGTIARARGIVHRTLDVRPWHVAAVEKAARALYLLM